MGHVPKAKAKITDTMVGKVCALLKPSVDWLVQNWNQPPPHQLGYKQKAGSPGKG